MPLSIIGLSPETHHPLAVYVDGRRRYFKSFSIKFDAQEGTVDFKGENQYGRTERCYRVNRSDP